jgi:hypothetical protein
MIFGELVDLAQKWRRRQKLLSLCLFPGYRWCGPGCSGPGAPINDVDACCMRHDRCLDSGIHPCECDQELIECLRYKKNQNTVKGRHAALMYDFMKVKTAFSCGKYRRN